MHGWSLKVQDWTTSSTFVLISCKKLLHTVYNQGFLTYGDLKTCNFS